MSYMFEEKIWEVLKNHYHKWLIQTNSFKVKLISETFRQAFIAKSGATENDVEDDNSSQYNSLLHKKLSESQ